MNPFDHIHDKLDAIAIQLLAVEKDALGMLPSVPWDFSVLHGHLLAMALLVKKQLPLQACKLHGEFIKITPPAVMLGRIRSPAKKAAAYRASLKAAKTRTEEKRAASRENLVRARLAKLKRAAERRPPPAVLDRLAELRADLKHTCRSLRREAGKQPALQDSAKHDRLWSEKERLNRLISELRKVGPSGLL